jgi:deoxyribodipyrimidine photo-lyase
MIFHGKPEEAIFKVFKSLAGSKLTLVLQTEVTKEEMDVEKCLQKICQETRASYINIWGSTLYHKGDLPFQINHVPDSYTGFRKDVEEKLRIRPEITMPDKMKPVPTLAPEISWGNLPTIEGLNSTKPIPCLSSAFPFNGGETAALQRLKSYLWDTNAVAQYKETRNGLIGTEYSTKFSPWLAHGCLSPRRIHWELEKYELQRTKNQSTYWVRFELLWRDYFKFVSMKYGDRIFYPNGMKGKRQQWKKDMELFKAWQSTILIFYWLLIFKNSLERNFFLDVFTVGRTGVPFVDANMRELLATGWMSNRGRQNVASFLVKDLLLDWRLGAEWFESLLLDHDVCSNYGNWNYVAGI